jgi:hypothetical protein
LKIFLPVDVRKNKNKSSTVVFPTAPICKYQQLKTEHEIVSEAITRRKKRKILLVSRSNTPQNSA